MSESSKARAYEAMYPGTGIPEAQKEERYEREAFKRERLSLRRTGRNRGFVMPADAWERIFGKEAHVS